MIESTLRFDDVGDIYQAFSHFSGQFRGHICCQENGAGDGLGTRLLYGYFKPLFCMSTSECNFKHTRCLIIHILTSVEVEIWSKY